MKCTKLQIAVVNKARRMLKKQPWFKGVCLDLLKDLDDRRIKTIGAYRAAREIYVDTEFYDNPVIWGR